MYKIVVVEDELIESQALVSLLKEEFSGLLEVFSASNGVEALTLIHGERPSILICDINLPGISGLEVIASAKAKDKEILSLILTSYSYFEYAQEAVKLGVEDFMIKPVSIDKMKNTIYEMINKLDSKKTTKTQTTQLLLRMTEMKPIIESDCIHSIIRNASVDEIARYFSLLNIAPKMGLCIVFQEEGFQLFQVQMFMKSVEEFGYRCMLDNYYDVHVLFVFGLAAVSDTDIKFLETLIITSFQWFDKIGVSDIYQQYEDFYKSYMDAILKISKPVKLSKDQTFSNEQIDYLRHVNEVCRDLNEGFIKFDKEGVDKKLNMFYLEILYFDKAFLVKVIYNFNKTLLYLFNQEFNTKITIYNEAFIIEINNENPYEQLLGNMEKVIHNLWDIINATSLSASKDLVKKALAYIALNYTKPITLNQVAKNLGVTPFYISTLLSKQTDKNFTDLVTHYRIEKSKKMLKEDRQIKDIAFELGFQSHNYFTKVFKKIMGVTPKEYKSKYQG